MTPLPQRRPLSRVVAFVISALLIGAGSSVVPRAAGGSGAAVAPGAAGSPSVVAVPWLGNESLQHQVYSGGQVTLQAVASDLSDGSPITLTSATWDPGDGSGPTAISVANPLALEKVHTYTGVEGQPFTAVISVTDVDDQVYTDTFKVVIKANVRETRVNMAIDQALWNLHKNRLTTTSDGQPSACWLGPGYSWLQAGTASTVQAFAINNHRESGDPDKDPYVTDVKLGMRFLLSLEHGKLNHISVPTQNGNDPDANGNGYGLVVSVNDHASYLTGQVIDAIVSSGTPDATADIGEATYVRGRTYKDIVQDLLDGYSWGMADNTGGWHYGYADLYGANDTSASHWWAVGVLAARNWGLDAPEWVKNIQKTVGIPLMQAYSAGASPGTYSGDCYFGYTNSTNPLWDAALNVTAAGLILMNADELSQTSERFTCAEKYLADRFDSTLGNFYAMYQVTKAMRTALDDDGATAPITMLDGWKDWYADYADYLVGRQNALGTGAINGPNGTPAGYIQGDLATSWAVIMLSPSLFEQAPTAVCSVDSTFVCAAGATCGGTETGVFSTANFDGSQSTPGDNPIASYAWNFQDGSAVQAGTSVTHTFGTLGTYPVQLTVTDTKSNSSSVVCSVTVQETALPPVALAGGPYEVCLNRTKPLILDASASFGRGASIDAYAWDYTAPVNLASADSTSMVTGDLSAYFRGLGIGAHDIALRVSDDSQSDFSATVYSTVNVLPGTDPKCNRSPSASNQAVTVEKDKVRSITLVATEWYGDALTYSVVAGPTHGTLSGTAPNVTYTPAAGYTGSDAFTFQANNGVLDSNVATVSITVEPASNAAPTASPQTLTANEDTPLSIILAGTDIDGDALTYTVVTQPAHGTLSGSGANLTYTPALNFNGADSFTFRTNDGALDSTPATIAITVVPVNDAPAASAQSVTLNEDASKAITLIGTDVDGDALTYTVVTPPAHGTLSASGANLTYTPALNFNGADSFTFRTNDGVLDSTVATIAITVVPVNDAPTASVSLATQSVQYSDAVQPVSVTGSDPETAADGLAVAFSYTKDGGTPVAGLPSGLVQGGTGGAWTVSGTAGVSAGSYLVTATVTDAGGAPGALTATTQLAITVVREDALAQPAPTAPSTFQVSSPGGTASVIFCASVAEAPDASPGLISNGLPVEFSFAPVAPGTTIRSMASTGTTQSGILTACASLSNVPVNVYDVTITIGGDYYTGTGQAVIVVYDPSQSVTTGAGLIERPGGVRGIFGFSVKYANKTTQGQFFYRETGPGGAIVAFKSNSMQSLAVSGSTAVFLGRATRTGFAGNHSFRVTAAESGGTGSSDTFGLQIQSPNGTVNQAFSFAPLPLVSGKIIVPQK